MRRIASPSSGAMVSWRSFSALAISGREMESVMTRDSFDALGIKDGDTVQVAVSALNVLLLKP